MKNNTIWEQIWKKGENKFCEKNMIKKKTEKNSQYRLPPNNHQDTQLGSKHFSQ